MRVLITGSSGQIGTNLALRLLGDGHSVFGVDKRQNAWSDAFPTLLQDLAGHFRRSPAGSAASSIRKWTSSSTSPLTPRSISSSRNRTARWRTR